MEGIYLDVLSLEDVQRVRQWRNQDLAGLRTPYPLTREMQDEFYRDVVNNRNSQNRYWAVARADSNGRGLLGMAGLTDVSYINGSAEISLIVDPGFHRHGVGTEAVAQVLRHAFDRMRLLTVFGEVYLCNPAVEFWKKIVSEHSGYITTLPNRKFWAGRLWNSLYFSIYKELWPTSPSA